MTLTVEVLDLNADSDNENCFLIFLPKRYVKYLMLFIYSSVAS